FRQRNYARCLAIFQEIAPLAPRNIVVENYTGNCAEHLKDYPVAIAAYKRALAIAPNDWCNVSSLATAYSLAGMKPDADSSLADIRRLKSLALLPEDFRLWIDQIELKGGMIRTLEFYPDL